MIRKAQHAGRDVTGLGGLFSLARELKGLTLRQLEAECGVSNALLSQIETGKVKDPGFSTVVRIARALGLSLDRLAQSAKPDTSMLRAFTPRVPDRPGSLCSECPPVGEKLDPTRCEVCPFRIVEANVEMERRPPRAGRFR